MAANGEATPMSAIWPMQSTKVAKVLRAETGSSMSISMRSWLKRLSVTPVSVVAKKDMGELALVSIASQRGRDYLPKHCVQKPLVEVYTAAWHHRDDELPKEDVSISIKNFEQGVSPAADYEKDECQNSNHRIDTEIVPEALVGKLFIVLCPKLDPDS